MRSVFRVGSFLALALLSSSWVTAQVLSLDFDAPASQAVTGDYVGEASNQSSGPTSDDFESMPPENWALVLNKAGDHVRFPSSVDLQFDDGDTITIECWIRSPIPVNSGQNIYLIGKGRTNPGQSGTNQNYALRLRGSGGKACLSFLFRSRDSEDQTGDFHRWTSRLGVAMDDQWHHVAVRYKFGDPDSIVGTIDGRTTNGQWDMGGKSTRPPVIDDDELWIGSSLGGSTGSSFVGQIDGVRIHRDWIDDAVLQTRRVPIVHPPTRPNEGWAEGSVNIRTHEGMATRDSWPTRLPDPLHAYAQDFLFITSIPQAYAPGGVRRDFEGTVLVRSMMEIVVDDETEAYRFLVRAGGLSRLWLNDQVIADTPPQRKRTDAHQDVDFYETDDSFIRRPHPGHHEVVVTKDLPAGRHLITLDTLIGGKGLRPAPGEILVAMSTQDKPWKILSPTSPDRLPTDQLILTDTACESLRSRQQSLALRLNDRHRRLAAARDDAHWKHRHRHARDWVRANRDNATSKQSIDDFLRGDVDPAIREITDDAWARRLYLQTLGVTPTNHELQRYRAHGTSSNQRRQWLIDQVLDDNRWADHWTAYWMDVLAENPNILKPTLNNTGPFRWFLYESMRDNVAVDRWVTNLIRMEGSIHGGGPAGFGMAAQNDVPMAAKAHVIGTAFLAANMKCARCHDAPYHDWTQGDLFSMAAMLKNESIKVPSTSSVPAAFFGDEDPSASLIQLSLKPGDDVDPNWTLHDYTGTTNIKPDLLGRDDSPRERLAALITNPSNDKFAKTIVNRIWKRFVGEAIVEPVHDWDSSRASHPELLDWLATQFVLSGYDAKSLTRLIVSSRLYQSASVDRPIASNEDERHFDAPRRRRMTAEQIVDSMHVAVGRDMNGGPLNFDLENTRFAKDFTDLGRPTRSWQLTSLSNERDRPSLTLPRAAAICECLEAFGWTGSRQEPIQHRDDDPNVVQPGVLANGTLSIQLTRLTDHDAVTQICIDATTVDELVTTLFVRFLSRSPTEEERRIFTGLLGENFDQRLARGNRVQPTPVREAFVHWGNHLSVEANEIRQREMDRLRSGPTPTGRLDPTWREKAEDAVWALINTPEFQYLP